MLLGATAKSCPWDPAWTCTQINKYTIFPFSLWPPKDESNDIPISLSLNWCESSNLDMRTISTVQTPTSLQSKKVLLAATPLGISYFHLTTTFHENYKVLKSRLWWDRAKYSGVSREYLYLLKARVKAKKVVPDTHYTNGAYWLILSCYVPLQVK